MKNLYRWSFLLLGLVSFLTFSSPSYAQEGANMTLSPALLDITAHPGDIVKQKFRIRNNNDSPINISIFIDKLDSKTQNGDVVPVAAQPGDTSISWLAFDKTTLTVPPREWVEIPFTMAIPKDAAFGYYYAIRIGQSQSDAKTQGAGAKLLGQVVLPVLLTVTSVNTVANMSLISFSAHSFFNEYLPVAFDVKIANKGNIHLRPQGNIFIRTGSDDKDAAVLSVNPADGAILPQSTRVFQPNWTDGFLVMTPTVEDGVPILDKNHQPIMHLTINWDKLTHIRIGKYTATVLVVYDNGTRDVPLEATTTFFVFPYTIVTIIFITFIGGLFTIRFILKWYISREISKKTHHKE